MTFIGFNINKFNRSLVDQQTGVTLVENIVSKHLWDALQRNKVPLQENFDDLTRYSIIYKYMQNSVVLVILCYTKRYRNLIILWYRDEKIQRLCRVVGNEFPQDPDEAYELTTDNAKKMMAIFMRFRYVHVFVI